MANEQENIGRQEALLRRTFLSTEALAEFFQLTDALSSRDLVKSGHEQLDKYHVTSEARIKAVSAYENLLSEYHVADDTRRAELEQVYKQYPFMFGFSDERHYKDAINRYRKEILDAAVQVFPNPTIDLPHLFSNRSRG